MYKIKIYMKFKNPFLVIPGNKSWSNRLYGP